MSVPASTRYSISIPAPHTHLIHVVAEFDLDALPAGPVELHMAAWTPGSYLIREYARHVEAVRATSGPAKPGPEVSGSGSGSDAAGAPLPIEKTAKNVWRVDRGEARSITVRYQVYAHELTVRTSHVDDSHAFWNGAPTYLWIPALASAPHQLTVQVPEGWQVDVALPETSAGAFLARDLDELIDSPVECGTQQRLDFTAAGRPHRIAIYGRPDGTQGFDAAAFTRDVAAIVEAHSALFGPPPYARYLFILHLGGGYGGLEHRASCTLLSGPSAFHPRKRYEELLELVSHEYFHVWNVKRIRPRALGPFDYEREAYTRSLWVMEGITSYYDRLALRRAGLLPAQRYLEKLGEEWGKLLAIPGRAKQSVAESSFDAWIKLYRPDENSLNSTVSYYLKGSLVVLALDLELRLRSEGARSMDDVMRLLAERIGGAPAGFDDDAVQALFESATGLALGEAFEHLVRGRGEIDLDRRLAWVGLRLEADWDGEPKKAGPSAAPAGQGPGAGAGAGADDAPPWLGARLNREGARSVVAGVPAGCPAEAGGLYAGDEVLALDGLRVDAGSLPTRLAARRPGDVVTLTVFRRDQLRELCITLGTRPRDRFEVVAMPEAEVGVEARARYQAWMGEPWPPRKERSPR